MNKKLAELIGWYGALALLGAYASNSFGWLSQQHWLYQVLNLTGALGIVYISLFKRTYQPAILNIIWAVVALIALGQLLV